MAATVPVPMPPSSSVFAEAAGALAVPVPVNGVLLLLLSAVGVGAGAGGGSRPHMAWFASNSQHAVVGVLQSATAVFNPPVHASAQSTDIAQDRCVLSSVMSQYRSHRRLHLSVGQSAAHWNSARWVGWLVVAVGMALRS